MKKRLKFSCWHCQRIFSLLLEIDEKPDLLSECPYCEQEVLIELDPYREKITTVFRTDANKQSEITAAGEFDEIIPTKEPEKEEPTE